MSLITTADFFARAGELRDTFCDRFARPFEATPDRFIWDYWHVPGHFTYLRTLARRFFSPELFRALEHALTRWGTEHLGCSAIAEPWLSYYIDGCRQELHSDIPHGPWSFVLSLTDWQNRRFSGGETVLLSEKCLDCWCDWSDSPTDRLDDLVTAVPAEFNQLTVFDARRPHGVQIVEGVRDPAASRIVIHGWFRWPEIILSDEIRRDYSAADITGLLQPARERMDTADFAGLLTTRVSFDRIGRVSHTEVLSNTVRSTRGRQEECQGVVRRWDELLRTLELKPGSEASSRWMIVPLRLPMRPVAEPVARKRGIFH